MGKKKQERRRDGTFMSKPQEGWKHDNRGLAVGRGVFCSFPCFYLGSVLFTESLRHMEPDDQTAVCREAIAHIREKTKHRPKEKRKVKKVVKAYEFGDILNFAVKVNLCVSADGIIIAPFVEDQGTELDGVLSFSEMKYISLAAGGENSDYEMVSYVAKDESQRRECHVFDCGELSDEVLETIGQAFGLAQDLARRERHQKEEAKRKRRELRKSKQLAAEEAEKKKIAMEKLKAEREAEKGKGAAEDDDEDVVDTFMDAAEQEENVDSFVQVARRESIAPEAGGGYIPLAPEIEILQSVIESDEKDEGDTVNDSFLALVTTGGDNASAAANLVEELNKAEKVKKKKSPRILAEQKRIEAEMASVKLKNVEPVKSARPTWVYYNAPKVMKKLDVSTFLKGMKLK